MRSFSTDFTLHRMFCYGYGSSTNVSILDFRWDQICDRATNEQANSWRRTLNGCAACKDKLGEEQCIEQGLSEANEKPPPKEMARLQPFLLELERAHSIVFRFGFGIFILARPLPAKSEQKVRLYGRDEGAKCI